MSQIEPNATKWEAAIVRQRGALPVAPLAMPEQRLEWPRRKGPLFVFASLFWGRPMRAGR